MVFKKKIPCQILEEVSFFSLPRAVSLAFKLQAFSAKNLKLSELHHIDIVRHVAPDVTYYDVSVTITLCPGRRPG